MTGPDRMACSAWITLGLLAIGLVLYTEGAFR
jgi:hypothetical protein